MKHRWDWRTELDIWLDRNSLVIYGVILGLFLVGVFVLVAFCSPVTP